MNKDILFGKVTLCKLEKNRQKYHLVDLHHISGSIETVGNGFWRVKITIMSLFKFL